eukprot:CAMPEP_0201551642 /NCGR_PEP_ID=MMETSP0173_2-20130828/8489_1 /ASSEMBLY_ACC=CAM_ASM_000268 /TAXON_ID=218659 /ORGANISM="Vexillifera sp., Strain DIVA3 564/2" /LENGTH=536 /DNA_ID=CAMNT_0047961949 /DNA_START=10 /DNA_END=1620 /DNA_ORIENTATION=+
MSASTLWGSSSAASSGNIQKRGGAAGVHSFSDEEKYAFVEWINDCLGKDPDLKHLLPLSPDGDDLFKAMHDGILLCKLINDAVKDTIDERVINKGKNGQPPNTFKIGENQVLAIQSSKAIGCNVINIGAHDLMEGTPHLVLGLCWQIIKIGLFAKINLVNHPELYRLLEGDETVQDLLKLPVEDILIRWVNYHLAESGETDRRVKNFTSDIKDSVVYTHLLAQIAPASKGVDKNALNENDLNKRAELTLQQAEKLECRKFLRPKNIVNGHPKLNLAFVANLFNKWPALSPVDDEPIEIIEETREEKTYRNFMNSLGVDPFVNNLYEDLRDGIVLIRLFKAIDDSIVDDKRVNWPPYRKIGANMKKLENCNYVIELGRQSKFSLVGIQGKDIQDAHKVSTLALVWQMMRAYTLKMLEEMSPDGKRIGDNEIIEWANSTCAGASKQSKISSFKDSKIASSLPIADLIDAIRPGSINYDLIEQTQNEEELLKNARYVITVGRQQGAVIFALPEDVVEVMPKMVMTLYAGLMAVGLSKKE